MWFEDAHGGHDNSKSKAGMKSLYINSGKYGLSNLGDAPHGED
jgi:hypothetical protein